MKSNLPPFLPHPALRATLSSIWRGKLAGKFPLDSIVAVAFALVSLLSLSCGRDADPVKAAIDRFVRSAEKRNASEVTASLTADFQGGGMNREQAESMVRGYLAGYDDLKITLSQLSIKHGEDVAVANFQANLVGKPANIGGLAGLLPSESSYRFEIRLVPEKGEWKIAWAKWEEATGKVSGN